MKRRFTYLLLLVLCPFVGWAQINTERVMAIGRNALYFEDYVLSIQYFNQVINAKPYLAEPYFFRGLAKINLDDFPGAESDCTESIERNPFVVNAYQVRGLARIQQNKLSDEELAVLAANGDDEAMAHLIYAVTPIARAKASGFANARISNEDLAQEGMLGFLDAVKNFDPSKGVPFRAFAETCINNRIISAVRMNFNSKNVALSNAVSFETKTGEIAADSDPADIVSDKFETEYLSELLSSGLSEFEKKVIDLRLLGKSYSQIAEELGRSEKAVDNAIQRIKSKMRRKLNK